MLAPTYMVSFCCLVYGWLWSAQLALASVSVSVPPRDRVAKLTEFYIDPHVMKNVVGASVRIDGRQRFATLKLVQAANRVLGPVEREFKLPVVSVTTDACEVQVTRAREDGRPMDRELLELEIWDHSESVCGSAEAHEPTEVVFRTQSEDVRRHRMKTVSTFSGPELRPE